MRMKEIYVEAKKSKNFQTYTSGCLVELDSTDNIEEVREKLMAMNRKAVQAQITLDKGK